MIRAAFLFVLIGLSVWLAVWFADNPGQVGIEIAGHSVNTKAGVLILGLLIFAVLTAGLYRFWRFIWGAPSRLAERRRSNRQGRGYQALTQGMVAVAAGDADEAMRHAERANGLLNDPPLIMLLSAQAAQLEGDEDAARRYFENMLDVPDMAFLGVRGLLMQAIRRGDHEEALRLANQAQELRPDTPWVLSHLFDLQAEARQWELASETLGKLTGLDSTDAEASRRRRMVVAIARSEIAADAGDLKAAAKLAREAFDLDPEALPALLAHSGRLVAIGRFRRARKVLETAWMKSPHPELARAYRDLVGPDEPPLERVKRLRRLYDLRPDAAESRLLMAQASLDAELWGEARRYLEGGTEQDHKSRRYCLLMVDLEERGSRDLEAARRWRELAELADEEEAWHCRECGHAAQAWRPSCDSCGEFDGLRWMSPPQTPALESGREAPKISAIS